MIMKYLDTWHSDRKSALLHLLCDNPASGSNAGKYGSSKATELDSWSLVFLLTTCLRWQRYTDVTRRAPKWFQKRLEHARVLSSHCSFWPKGQVVRSRNNSDACWSNRQLTTFIHAISRSALLSEIALAFGTYSSFLLQISIFANMTQKQINYYAPFGLGAASLCVFSSLCGVHHDILASCLSMPRCLMFS